MRLQSTGGSRETTAAAASVGPSATRELFMNLSNYRLRLPGPTPVPQRIQHALTTPMLNHRGPEFHEVMAEIQTLIKPVFGTSGDVLLFAATGTGVMEASFANVIAPGDSVLCIANGQWGELFAKMARGLGASVDVIAVPWGTAVDINEVARALQGSKYRAVLITHNESSTGVVTPLEPLGALLQETDTLLVADAVSSLGAMPVDQDAAGADIVFAASQKALMCPPGIGLVALSERARSLIEDRPSVPGHYWNFARALNSLTEYETPSTPAVAHVLGLRESLRMIHEEGLSNVFERHRRMANALRAGLTAIRLSSLPSSQVASDSLVVARVPEPVRSNELIRHLYERYRTVVAGARNRLSGKVIRIGTMGSVSEADVLTDLHFIERSLEDLGERGGLGAGVSAASAALAAES